MDSVAIHIGFHKAGSTYLQKMIFPKMEVNYVFLSGYKRSILDNVQSVDQFDEQKVKGWINDEIARKYNRRRPLTIISQEELSGHPHGYAAVDPFAVAANLKKAFPSSKIIIIIRDQFKYMISLYTFRTAIKGSETRSMNRFFDEEGELGLFQKLEYDRVVGKYQSLFGAENVLTLSMELLETNARAFHCRLADFLGVPVVEPEHVRAVNESTKLQAVLYFWRTVNFGFNYLLGVVKLLGIQDDEEYPQKSLRYGYYSFKRKTTSRLNRLLASSHKIDITSYPGYAALLSRFSESNARLQEMLDTDLQDLGYPVKAGATDT